MKTVESYGSDATRDDLEENRFPSAQCIRSAVTDGRSDATTLLRTQQRWRRRWAQVRSNRKRNGRAESLTIDKHRAGGPFSFLFFFLFCLDPIEVVGLHALSQLHLYLVSWRRYKTRDYVILLRITEDRSVAAVRPDERNQREKGMSWRRD